LQIFIYNFLLVTSKGEKGIDQGDISTQFLFSMKLEVRLLTPLYLLRKYAGMILLLLQKAKKNNKSTYSYTSGPADPINSKVSRSQNLTVLSAEPE
jgi:hypothetical protein